MANLIGPLCSANLQGAVTLTIGYHQLEGKRLEVKKPLVLLDKVAGKEGHCTEYQVSPCGTLP